MASVAHVPRAASGAAKRMNQAKLPSASTIIILHYACFDNLLTYLHKYWYGIDNVSNLKTWYRVIDPFLRFSAQRLFLPENINFLSPYFYISGFFAS